MYEYTIVEVRPGWNMTKSRQKAEILNQYAAAGWRAISIHGVADNGVLVLMEREKGQ
jgi:hypothetical protein